MNELSPFPVRDEDTGESAVTSHEEWLDLCQELLAQFYGLKQRGKIRWYWLQYVRNRDGHPRGAALVWLTDDGTWYAGGSYCSSADRHRFTRVEARARAIERRQSLYVSVDFNRPTEDIAWLAHFPRSCRGMIAAMMRSRPPWLLGDQTSDDARPVGTETGG